MVNGVWPSTLHSAHIHYLELLSVWKTLKHLHYKFHVFEEWYEERWLISYQCSVSDILGSFMLGLMALRWGNTPYL